MRAALLHCYQNGGFEVSLHADGTKVRTALVEGAVPALPEHMDLKITDWCDAGCAWCHEASTPRGAHADLDAALQLLLGLPAGTELALGGGDPLAHPKFEYFVSELVGRGLVPSVTVNGRHFDKHRPVLERLTQQGKLFGVGVSYFDALPQWDYEHMVVHLIAGVHAPSVLDAASRRYKALLLGYKQHGRGAKLFKIRPQEVQSTIDAWYRELFVVAQAHHLSFDNLAIEQLKPERLFRNKADYQSQYMGEEGMFGMYIDAVTQTFALSSYAKERFAWSALPAMFSQIRAGQGFAV